MHLFFLLGPSFEAVDNFQWVIAIFFRGYRQIGLNVWTAHRGERPDSDIVIIKSKTLRTGRLELIKLVWLKRPLTYVNEYL